MSEVTRRGFVAGLAASAAVATSNAAQNAPLKGRIKQSATTGCFGKLRSDIEEVCRISAKLGLKGLDLVGIKEYPVLKKYGLIPTMLQGVMSLTEGVNHVDSHAAAEERFKGVLKEAVEWSAPNIILLSGNRRGISEEEGLANTVAFINKIKAAAEDKGVTLCLELLNSKVNHKENHAALEPQYREAIERAAAAGAPNVIALSGNKRGIADEEGMDNTVTFLNKIKALAEDKNITVCLELLNSKVNHKDYQCDRTWWGVEVMKRVNSPRVKLLYDIYHMQIMEGDIIRTIRDNIQYIGHFHTAGNPGRHELDATQELNYKAIAQAIVDAGFTGYFAHEYGPVGDPLAGLEQAISTCDVY